VNIGINRDIQAINLDSASRGMTLREVLEILLESRWLIAGFVLISCLAAWLHIFIMTPVYESDVLLQVDQRATGIGALADFSDLSTFYDGAQVEMEMEILKSRTVLGPVVDKLSLNVNATPDYFPVVGAAIARNSAVVDEAGASPWIDSISSWTDRLREIADNRFDLSWLNLSWLDLNKYVWSDASAVLSRFNVPEDHLGEAFTLVAGEAGHYRLLDRAGKLLTDGVVGKPQEVWPAAVKPHTLLISELEAAPGTHFDVSVKPRLEAIYNLEQSLIVTAVGYSEESSSSVPSGLIKVSLEGADPDKTTAITNEIAAIYLRQNAARKSGQAEDTLKSLRNQLPKVKAEMDQAEAALLAYRTQNASVDIPREQQSISDKIVTLETALTQLRQERDYLRGRFTPKFTARADAFAALEDRIAALAHQKESLQAQMNDLPSTQQGIMGLQRDVQVNRQLYSLLSNKLHELNVVNAGTYGNVRVIDYAATPTKPIGAGKSLVASIYLVWGLLLGIGIALARKFWFDVVEDPDVIEQRLGLPVYAVVPHSEQQDKITRKGYRRGKHTVLSARDVEDVASESLRSLRTWLYFALLGANNNVVLITGPGPGVGKSFLSVNLAAVLALAGKRTLVIDADLRKGHLHQYFGMSRKLGLSNVISGEANIKEAIRATEIDGLCILPTGSLPSNPSEVLLNERFASILTEISAGFDHVIVDSPPVLPVTDAAILGRLAGAALLVVKAGTHPLREIEQTIKRLRQVDVDLKGVVFNDMMSSKYYGYGKYYGHAYTYSRGE